MSNLVIFNKPFGVLSQFTDSDGHPGLSSYIELKGFYPAGRLDRDSEGLLLLTNDGSLQAHISNPGFKMPKTYLVQVEGVATGEHLALLESGVSLNDGLTRPAEANLISEPKLWPRTPPVRFRKSIPTSWIELTIREGRNRQVRRMTAAVGIPTLRLVRSRIGPWQLNGLEPGSYRLEDTQIHSQNSRPRTSRTPARETRNARQNSSDRRNRDRKRR